jgi:hypothetical protein
MSSPPSDTQLPGLEGAKIVARPLLSQWPVEGCDVAATITIEPLDNPVVASLAIGMDAYLPDARVAHGGIIETLAAV